MMNLTHTTTITPTGERRILTLPDWSSFSVDTVISELEALHERGRKLADAIALIAEPTFADIVFPFEEIDACIGLVVGPVRHLKSVQFKTYPGLVQLDEQVSNLGTTYATDLALHEGLHGAYQRLRDGVTFSTLSTDEQYLVTRTLRDFALAGVALPPDKKAQLKLLHQEATKLGTTFSNNDQEATDAWNKIVTDAEELRGIPADDQARMQTVQKEKGGEGFLVTLQQPDAIAVLKFAEHRPLREEVSRAWVTVASEFSSPDGKWDNTPVIKAIVRNAHESARLLGYHTYAEVSLAPKMANSVGVDGVRTFLEELVQLARPKAITEFAAMQSFASEKLGIAKLESWDFAFVEERMRKELYALDSEAVREYFPFTKVMEGLSYALKQLFDLTLVPRATSTWNSEVKFYELRDASGVLRGAFYADMYAREGKRSGAWMDTLIASRKTKEGTVVPVAYLNCNASRSSDGGDAYLTHDQVETLFHEFGHTLHHIAGESTLLDLSMESVEWDTVELPSQFFEHWTWKKKSLAHMTAKKGGGESIPDSLVDRMHAVRHFNTGLATLRQAIFGLYDWELYSTYDPNVPIDPIGLWWKISREIDVRPMHPDNRFPTAFGHIFAGGYAAGYFSYMWALALAADAEQVFEEDGDIFSRTIGMRYLKEIIAPGSSRPMAVGFEAFRGRKLDPNALALHLGLVES